MAYSTETRGPVLFTAGEIGDWGGHEAEVADELNEHLEQLMAERYGIIHAGGGNWVITMAGDYPSATEVDGKPEWDGLSPMDWDDVCNNPERYLSDELAAKVLA